MPEPPEPDLDPEASASLSRAVEEFNAGRYFECHDTLEETWSGLRGPGRAFFQGLIQVAVGLYHLEAGNLRGGQSQLDKAVANLAGFGDVFLGVDLGALRDRIGEIRAGLEAGSTALAGAAPRIRLETERA